MPSASREFDFAASYSRFVVKHTCCAFWLSLSCTLLLCGVGIVWAGEDAKAKGQSGILSKQTGYDWTVTGALLMKQKDMVDSALGGRDRDELKAVAERTQEYHGRFSFQFLYYWKDGRQEDMWTADTLQQMCEVENVILSTPGYEKVCPSRDCTPHASRLTPHASRQSQARALSLSGPASARASQRNMQRTFSTHAVHLLSSPLSAALPQRQRRPFSLLAPAPSRPRAACLLQQLERCALLAAAHVCRLALLPRVRRGR